MNAQHRGGRRSWRRRAPGIVVALLAAAGAGGVADAALMGTHEQTAAAGAAGAVVTLAAGLIGWSRRHRATHRLEHALDQRSLGSGLDLLAPVSPVGPAEPAVTAAGSAFQPAIVAAMSTPPVPRAVFQPSGPAMAPSLFALPALSLVNEAERPIDPMVDTVPHPVIKLFPMRELEPELAAGSIDERVFAALDAQREATVTAALAGGRHAAPLGSIRPGAGAANPTSYRSRHSA